MGTHESPSIFELIACDSLKNGLREALRYFLDNISAIEGFKGMTISKSDEAILLLDIFIEYNYLKSYNASYAENLYNLIRVSRDTGEKNASAIPSLICLTIFPYLKRKLDKYFEELNYKENRSADESQRIRLYRILTRSCSFFNLICMIRFCSGKANYHTLLDGLMNIRLSNRIQNPNNDNTDALNFSDKASKVLADLLGRGLTIGSYLIQFLDYWNTRSNSASLFNVSLPVPNPPKKDEFAYTDDKSSNMCLICLHVRQNECALSNTGYVFCYSCLQRFVTVKQRCPITGHPTTVDNIVKLFTLTPS